MKSALRDWLYESYSLIRITVISHLRWLSPLWCLTAPPSPRGIGRATKGKRLYGQARRLTSPDLHILCRMCTVDNKAPQSNPFTQRIAKNKVPPPGGRWWRQPPKGVHFRRPQGGFMVLYKMAPPRAPTSPAQRYYITPEGESPEPVREASAGPGQNPWRPGPSGPAAPSTLARRASTFGNTASRRFRPKSPSSQMIRTAKKH